MWTTAILVTASLIISPNLLFIIASCKLHRQLLKGFTSSSIPIFHTKSSCTTPLHCSTAYQSSHSLSLNTIFSRWVSLVSKHSDLPCPNSNPLLNTLQTQDCFQYAALPEADLSSCMHPPTAFRNTSSTSPSHHIQVATAAIQASMYASHTTDPSRPLPYRPASSLVWIEHTHIAHAPSSHSWRALFIPLFHFWNPSCPLQTSTTPFHAHYRQHLHSAPFLKPPHVGTSASQQDVNPISTLHFCTSSFCRTRISFFFCLTFSPQQHYSCSTVSRILACQKGCFLMALFPVLLSQIASASNSIAGYCSYTAF